MSLFKIIDITENYYILINKIKELFKLKKSEKLENLKLCQLMLIINNFQIIKGNSKKNLDEIIIKEINLIFHISQQEIFFSKIIPINFFQAIKFYFLDFKKDNYYDKMHINEKEFKIDNEEIICPFIHINPDFDYYPLEIILENTKIQNSKKEFLFFLYKGILNKINAFINYYLGNTYFMEYYYMSVDCPLKDIDIEENILVNGKVYKLNYKESFQSENRERYNFLNIPYQKINGFKEEALSSKNINSIQICKMIYKKVANIFGVFNIRDAIPKTIKRDNSYFDIYYKEFGGIIDLFDKYKYKSKKLKKKCLKIYDKSNIDKSKIIEFSLDNTELTLSQYKTRLGLIICHYLKDCKEEEDISKFIILFFDITFIVSKKKITYLQSLRIIILYLRKKMFDPNSLNEVIFFSSLDENSPYALARKLNIQEIKHLSEFSRYFAAYLQIDSYIMFNYYKNEVSYSFSLELLFVMKYLLLSNYEDFIFTTREKSNEYAYNTINENITVINESNIFTEKVVNIKDIKDIEESKNCAIPLSFEFRHKKNCHQKRANKNPHSFSPHLYYKDGKALKIDYKWELKEKKAIEKGESGIMIEKYFSDDDEIIIQLKMIHFFGELLDYKYFIDKDFQAFIKKMEEIKKKPEVKKEIQSQYGNSKCQLFDKMEKIGDLSEDYISKKRMEYLKKQGIIKVGDLHYTIEEFKRIFKMEI